METPAKWRLGMIAIIMTAACFIAGFLFLSPSKQQPTPPPQSPAAETAPTPLQPERQQKFSLTIESDADWARIIITNGTFITDPSPTAAGLELTTESPEQITKFTYAPTEIALVQKQWGHARITLKCTVESSDPVLQIKTGHGDNGKVTLRSPAGTITNDQVTGDGQNWVTTGLRLE